MEKFLLIGGAKASGKSLIRGVLDGHPELFVSIFHEVIFQSLYVEDADVYKKKDIQEIRTNLASKGSYYQLERLTRKAFYYTVAGADHRRINTKNFDFYSFDKSWVDDLYRKGTEWTSQEVCSAIYRSFDQHLHPFLKKLSKKKYYCSLSNGLPNAISGFLKTFPNSKIIYLKRDPIEMVDGLVKRVNSKTKKVPNDIRSNWFTRKTLIKKWCTFDFIKSVVELDKEADKALKKYPKQVLILKFSDFFDNSEKETMKIKKFLNISDHINLQNYSVGGIKIVNSDRTSFLSKQIDVDYAGLRKNEVKKLKSYLKKLRD
jgi:hypothetical protein